MRAVAAQVPDSNPSSPRRWVRVLTWLIALLLFGVVVAAIWNVVLVQLSVRDSGFWIIDPTTRKHVQTEGMVTVECGGGPRIVFRDPRNIGDLRPFDERASVMQDAGFFGSQALIHSYHLELVGMPLFGAHRLFLNGVDHGIVGVGQLVEVQRGVVTVDGEHREPDS